MMNKNRNVSIQCYLDLCDNQFHFYGSDCIDFCNEDIVNKIKYEIDEIIIKGIKNIQTKIQISFESINIDMLYGNVNNIHDDIIHIRMCIRFVCFDDLLVHDISLIRYIFKTVDVNEVQWFHSNKNIEDYKKIFFDNCCNTDFNEVELYM